VTRVNVLVIGLYYRGFSVEIVPEDDRIVVAVRPDVLGVVGEFCICDGDPCTRGEHFYRVLRQRIPDIHCPIETRCQEQS
jgi:hypothetical protein